MNNFFLRLILGSIVSLTLTISLFAYLLPEMNIQRYEELAKHLASTEANGSRLNPKTNIKSPPIFTIINENHLSWYYLTQGNGHLLSVATHFAPALEAYNETSGPVTWNDNHYYEFVIPVKAGINLHVGFANEPLNCFSGNFTDNQIPITVALCLVLVTIIICSITYFFSVTVPAQAITQYYRKNRNSKTTSKSFSAKGASSQIQDLQQLIDLKDKLAYEKQEIINDREQKIHKLTTKLKDLTQTVSKEKTVLVLKEAESQFIEQLSNELDSTTTFSSLGNTLLSMLHKAFPNTIKYALFCIVNRKKEGILVSHLGFSSAPMPVYTYLGNNRSVPELLETEMITVTALRSVKEPPIRHLGELVVCDQVVYVPVRFHNKLIGYLTVFLQQQKNLEDITRILLRSVSVVAKVLYHILVYEEKVEITRTDELTGFPNKNYLSHILPQLISQTEGTGGNQKPFSLLAIEGHDILTFNEKLGRQGGTTLIIELGQRINKILQERRKETLGQESNYLIRYQGAQFIVILLGVDSKKTLNFAQRLQQAIEGQSWPGNIDKWTTAIGISSFPEDTNNPEELIENVESALIYARGQLENRRIAHISQVPIAFRSTKASGNLGGSLDVFDPAALMQSLSLSCKSGILTVTHPDGKLFWCFLENGKPTKVKLSKFKGSQAIIEFLVLYDSGEFNFTDYSGINKETLEEIEKLDQTFNVSNSLEKTLMDGALARDHYLMSKEVLKQTDLYVWSTPAATSNNPLTSIKNLGDPINPDEEHAMREVLKMANGTLLLKSIFSKLDTIPTAALWRGTALLIQQEIIQLKKLATSLALW